MNVSLSWYSERVRVGVSLVAIVRARVSVSLVGIVKGEGMSLCWDSEG